MKLSSLFLPSVQCALALHFIYLHQVVAGQIQS